MRINLTVAIACAFLLASFDRSSAWIFQVPMVPPSEEQVDVSDEVDQFQSASADAVRAMSFILDAFASAEQDHVPLSSVSESLETAISLLNSSASSYSTLSSSDLTQVPLSWEAFASGNPVAADREMAISRSGIDPTNAADFAGALGKVCSDLASNVGLLLEISSFSPDEPYNLEARALIREISIGISAFMRIGNAGAAATATPS